MVLITQGNSLILPAHWEGGARASIDLVTAKNPVRPSGGAAEGGGGGNSAAPERIQKEASPAALLVQSRTQQKSFLFLLEEKIRRAQIRKSEENFFAGWRALASGGGLASLAPFPPSPFGLWRAGKVGSRKVYNYSTTIRQLLGAVLSWCAGEDSNLQAMTGTSPSSWRVYHFSTRAFKARSV